MRFRARCSALSWLFGVRVEPLDGRRRGGADGEVEAGDDGDSGAVDDDGDRIGAPGRVDGAVLHDRGAGLIEEGFSARSPGCGGALLGAGGAGAFFGSGGRDVLRVVPEAELEDSHHQEEEHRRDEHCLGGGDPFLATTAPYPA